VIFWEIIVLYIKPKLKEKELVEVPISEITSSRESVGFWKLAVSGGIIILFFIAIMRSAFDLGLKALAPSIINESYQDVSAVIATIMSTIIIVAGILGSFFGSILYSRFVRNEALAIVVLFTAAFPFVCLMLLVGKINYLFIVAFLALIVFILSTASMFTSSYIASRFNKWNLGASVAGFINGGAALGIVVANMLFTALADRWGWYFTISVWVILVAVSILLAGIFFVVWTKFLRKIKNM
jgi:OPA family glycerol-3-phosphate transporter-like MFS transporter